MYDKDEENYYIIHLRNKVKDKLSKIRNIGYSFTLSDVLMRKYIKKLKGNCSTCIGRICAEHLKYAHTHKFNTASVQHVLNLF